MPQEFEFPTDKVGSIRLVSEDKQAWVVELKGEKIFLVCPLIAANVDTFYVSCVGSTGGELPDYVKPMERNE